MLGLLSYLPTFAYMPHYTYLLALAWLAVKYREQLLGKIAKMFQTGRIVINTNLFIILLIVLLSLINRIVHPSHMDLPRDLMPFVLLVPLTYFIAIKLRAADLKVIVWLVAVECLFIYAEYIAGVTTFFTGLENYMTFGPGDLLYYKRPLGLSENSSTIAGKIILGLLIIDYLTWKTGYTWALRLVLLSALFLTFNRTAFVAYGIYNMHHVLAFKWKVYKVLVVTTIGTVMVAVIAYLAHANLDLIISQFTRNQGEVELAGRELIWVGFIEFIQPNWLFGYGSYRYLIPYHDTVSHAHNSYLQVIATNGIFIAGIYGYLILRNLRRHNVVFVLALLVYSMAQYGIFWGISLMDIALFFFLFQRRSQYAT